MHYYGALARACRCKGSRVVLEQDGSPLQGEGNRGGADQGAALGVFDNGPQDMGAPIHIAEGQGGALALPDLFAVEGDGDDVAFL